ncbi:MAG: NifU family protein [Patescibacteria group bacterium]
MVDKIKEVIDKIRPVLERDGGNIEFVDFDEKEGVVNVRLTGHCAHCPMSVLTLKEFVLAKIRSEIPEVKDIIAV